MLLKPTIKTLNSLNISTIGLLLSFLFLFSSCSSSKSGEKKNNKTKSVKTQTDSPVKTKLPTKIKTKLTSLKLPVPSNAIGYGILSDKSAKSFYIGYTNGKSALPFNLRGNLFFILLTDNNGTLIPVLYKKTKSSPNAKCIKIEGECYYADTHKSLINFREKKLKVRDSFFVLNFNNKNAAPFLDKWKKLKKLHIKKLEVRSTENEFEIKIKALKKVINKDLRNALFYWQQLAIESRTDIFRMGKYGELIAKNIVNSKIKLKRRFIIFHMSMNSETTGWVVMQLNRLYKVIWSGEVTENSNEKTN